MGATPLEPWLADMVEAAIAPWRGQLSDDDLAWMREQLAASLVPAPELREALGAAVIAADPELGADPHLQRLVDDARGRPQVDESGNLVRRAILEGMEGLDGLTGDGLPGHGPGTERLPATADGPIEGSPRGRRAGGGRDGAG